MAPLLLMQITLIFKRGFTLSIILYVKLFMPLDKELLHEFGYYVAKGN